MRRNSKLQSSLCSVTSCVLDSNYDGRDEHSMRQMMKARASNTLDKKLLHADEEITLKGKAYDGDLEGNLDVNLYHYKKKDKHLNIDTKIRTEKSVVNVGFAIMSKEGP